MMTVFYIPQSFVVCDSKWSINGFEINNIKEDNFILHASPSTGEMLVTLQAGSHNAIVLYQALLSGLITSQQFFNLFNLYKDYFELDYDFVTFALSNGLPKSRTHAYYPDNKRQGVYAFGSGGVYASSFYYHLGLYRHKKRNKKPPRIFSHSCHIIGAMQYAYSQDRCSGGKAYKVQWSDDGIVDGTILLDHENYTTNLKITLINTMREIHNMYIEKSQDQATATQVEKKPALPQKKLSDHKTAKVSSGNQATKMTVSNVIDHLKWFESL